MSDAIVYLHEVFESFGPITARGMFGGYVTYHDAVMLGLFAAGRWMRPCERNRSKPKPPKSRPAKNLDRIRQAALHRLFQYLAIFLRRGQAGVGFMAMVCHGAFDDFVKPIRNHAQSGQAAGQA